MRRRTIAALSLLFAGTLMAIAATPVEAALMHVVRPGDTLYQISLRYGVPVETIASVNGLRDPSQITAGQVLKIPQTDARNPGSADTRATQPPQERSAVRAVHRVRHGDTLLGIAWRYRVPVDDIKLANGLWSDVIHPDQRLAIPARGSAAALATRHMPLPEPVPVPRVAFERSAGEGSRGSRIIRDAMRYLGVPYLWGGASERGMDCSGFIFRVFERYAGSLGRARSYDYYRNMRPMAPEALIPGDLVFFTTDEPGPSHVGIFIGDGKFIHSSSTSGGVTITPLDDPYYGARFLGVRRLVNPH
jgi:peptidoglycan DL-endopeptidase LytE